MPTKTQITPQEVAEVLTNALSLMNEKGKHWVRRSYRRKIGMVDGKPEYAYCAVGAIEASTPRQSKLRSAARSAIFEELLKRDKAMWSIESWNDTYAKDFAEVQSVFKTAATRMRRLKKPL